MLEFEKEFQMSESEADHIVDEIMKLNEIDYFGSAKALREGIKGILMAQTFIDVIEYDPEPLDEP